MAHSTHKIDDIYPQLKLVYGEESHDVADKLSELIKNRTSYRHYNKRLDEKDVMLITYGDSIRMANQKPLSTLVDFYRDYAKQAFNTVHILPFYPWTSDDGFSVVNYHQVDPALGDWDDVSALAQECDLMFDAVINHISKSSSWFQKYLAGRSEVDGFFISADPEEDYSAVTRPRNLPLLTHFTSTRGDEYIWTTFSDDQIDLNFAEPRVLLAVLEVLIVYAQSGSRFIRLDAIGFIWKQLGTTCMHLPETHALIQIMRKVLDIVVPGTQIITETNVPHVENISYFGNGDNEASLVYQFPLPPLVMHTLLSGSSRVLSQWAESLSVPSENTAFLNFLASHDGVGVRPATGLLSEAQLAALLQHTEGQGGYVSYKDNGDGTKSPYELNISYFDAISNPTLTRSDNQQRMLAAHSILFALRGMPAVYVHSFIGSHSDRDGAEASGIPRRINRKKIDYEQLKQELSDPKGDRSVIMNGIQHMSSVRQNEPLFSPKAEQKILHSSDKVFYLERFDSQQRIHCITSIANEVVSLPETITGFDLLSGSTVMLDKIAPYERFWIKLTS